MVIIYIVIAYYSGTGLLVPAPFSIVAENTNNSKLGTNNQKLILFSLGNAMSGPPTNNGNKKLPNPPIKAGIQLFCNQIKLTFYEKFWGLSLEDFSLIFINVWTISLPLNIYNIY